jgi:uncharacterized protein YbjQ (UPF0145 family)
MRISSVVLLLVWSGCGAPSSGVQSPTSSSTGHVFVSPDHSCQPGCGADHFCNIVEIVDIHTQATSQDKGFDELRARAAAAGAEAVVDAEFEHGEGNEPSHLSGTLVRGCEMIPPYEVIGKVDIESDPDDTDKGMGQLEARKRALGGDRVVNIQFEHGEDGAKGHLRGNVIKFTR